MPSIQLWGKGFGAQLFYLHVCVLIATPTLPAQYADSVDLKGGLLTNRVCTVKFQIVAS